MRNQWRLETGSERAGKIDGKITVRTRQSAVSDRFNPSFSLISHQASISQSRGELAGRGCRGLRVRRVPGRAGRRAWAEELLLLRLGGGIRAYVAGAVTGKEAVSVQ
jgi:hypothetical protein